MEDWRFYRAGSWSSRTARLSIGWVSLGLIVFATVSQSVAAGVAVGVLLVVLYGALCARALKAGVQESRDGVSYYGAGYEWGSGALSWAEVKQVSYTRAGTRESVVAVSSDGRRHVIRGARRKMQWADGHTDDFATVLQSRADHFKQTTAI
jgi:hypothetical protein